MKLPTPRVATITALCSILGSMLILPAVFAQDNAGPSDRPTFQGGRMHGPGMGGARHGRGGPRQGNPENMIEHLDSNSDGKVSVEEFIAPQLSNIDEMFERRDTNDDGVITEGEGRRERPANAPARGNRQGRLERLDIDREELTACVRNTVADFDPPEAPDAEDVGDRFDNVDTNSDGSLSLAEVTAAAQARAEARFDKLDTNGDGFITTEEITALQEARQDVRAAVQACVKELAAD